MLLYVIRIDIYPRYFDRSYHEFNVVVKGGIGLASSVLGGIFIGVQRPSNFF